MVRTKSTSMVCEVEDILGHRRQNGVCKFRIKWKGYSEEFCTWQSEKDLKGSRQILAAYKAKNPDDFPGATPKRRSTRPAPEDDNNGKESSPEKTDESSDDDEFFKPSKRRSTRPAPGDNKHGKESSSEENDDSGEEGDVEVLDMLMPKYSSPGPSHKRPRRSIAPNNEMLDLPALEAADLKKKRSVIPANPDDLGKKSEPNEASRKRSITSIIVAKPADFEKKSVPKELPEDSENDSESIIFGLEREGELQEGRAPVKRARIDDFAEVIQDKPEGGPAEPKYGILKGLRIKSFNSLICKNGELAVNITYAGPLPDSAKATETVPTSVVRNSKDAQKLCAFFEKKLVQMGSILPSSS